MSVPSQVIELVERFERNLEAYKSGQYNETQVRREFIDPFFMALGCAATLLLFIPGPGDTLLLSVIFILAEIGFSGFAGAVDCTAHHCYFAFFVKGQHTSFDFSGNCFKIYFRSAARGT